MPLSLLIHLHYHAKCVLSEKKAWGFIDCQWIVNVKCQYDAAKKVRKSLKLQAQEQAQGKAPTGGPNIIVPTMGKVRWRTPRPGWHGASRR